MCVYDYECVYLYKNRYVYIKTTEGCKKNKNKIVF